MESAFWQMRRIGQGLAPTEALAEYLRSEFAGEPLEERRGHLAALLEVPRVHEPAGVPPRKARVRVPGVEAEASTLPLDRAMAAAGP